MQLTILSYRTFYIPGTNCSGLKLKIENFTVLGGDVCRPNREILTGYRVGISIRISVDSLSSPYRNDYR